jgi:hypothetical protein
VEDLKFNYSQSNLCDEDKLKVGIMAANNHYAGFGVAIAQRV